MRSEPVATPMPNTATDMLIVGTIAGVRDAVAHARASGDTIGFVPTMGALHEGHLSLVERARRETDMVVMSIFVNPLQFAPTEDLARYPRPVADDECLAKESGVDVLFRPDVHEMYPDTRRVTVSAGESGSSWEGASRPGHFDGVLTVVAKLFNIVQPDVAVFGQKDLQQAALVTAMVRDLDMRVRILLSPIVRESDGLAMSSRNRYLSAADRQSALLLSASLAAVRAAFDAGETKTAELERIGVGVLERNGTITADYFGVVDRLTFGRANHARAGFAAIVAARVGTTRLIDNMTLGSSDED